MTTRRNFITKTVLGGAAVVVSNSAMAMPASSYRRIIGSNDRLNVAIAGLGRRLGAYYDPISNKKANVQLLYLCDVMEKQRTAGLQKFSEHISYKPKGANMCMWKSLRAIICMRTN